MSTVAHDNNVSGCEHGAAVSKVASDGRSWAYSYVRVLSNLYVVEGLK